MTTAAQIAALQTSIAALITEVDELDVVDSQVNEELDAARRAAAIALSIANDPTYSDAQKIALIRETLEPQA